MRRIMLLVIVGIFLLTTVPAEAAKAKPDYCRDYACFHLKRHPRCPWKARHGFSAEQRKVRCEIMRATRHFHVSTNEGLYISWRESRWTENICDYAGSGHCGPFQMSSTLMSSTPYWRHSRFSAHWSALAYSWLAAHGQACHWNLNGYCS